MNKVEYNTKLISLADEIFMNTFGMGRSGSKYDRMRQEAAEVIKKIQHKVNVRSTYKYFDSFSLKGTELTVSGQSFSCKAFEKIEPQSVKGIYIYALSSGDFSCVGETTRKQLYADMWGNAVTDAGRIILREVLESYTAVSDSFGPGFYGMDVTEMVKIDALIDFSKVGVELIENKILFPLKSCAGIFLAVNETYKRLDAHCKYCEGKYDSCDLCSLNERV